ncbi:MAG: prolipoprotein diacylglyceryl transferase [Patescibacteria group bacterium]|nr:prolipoprotein diacylglyceryl transferase [Patescibacteria group bacterium]
MYPVLISIGGLTISTFGTLLALGLLLAVFVIWRIARVYDLSEEKVLDVALLTFFGGLIFARLFYVGLHWFEFADFQKILLINHYPGLSFWGGILGGFLSLWVFTKRAKLNFWQLADFAAVGLLIGIVIGDLGCFFGGCEAGVISNSILAAPVVGLVGKRFPISLIESLALLFIFLSLKAQVIRFHFHGKILALFMIWLGVVKLVAEQYRADTQILVPSLGLSLGMLASLILLLLGVVIFYQRSRRRLFNDLRMLAEIFYSRKRRLIVLTFLRKNCYNLVVIWNLWWDKAFSKVDFRLRIPKRRQYVR